MNQGKRQASVLVEMSPPLDPFKRQRMLPPWQPIPRVIASEDVAGCADAEFADVPELVINACVPHEPIPPVPAVPDVAMNGHPVCVRMDLYPSCLNDEAITGFNPWMVWRR